MAKKLSDLLNSQKNSYGNRCEHCGYGYLHTDETGIRKWCKRCIDAYRRCESGFSAEKMVLKQVGELYAHARLAHLDENIAEKLCSLVGNKDVFMFGAVGTGKTYAMAAALRWYAENGYICRRINFDDFCIELRATMSPDATTTEWGIIESLKGVDKLFIDDLGLRSKQETDFAYVTLYSILNKRQERMLPTFVTSNKSIEQLGQHFDARIASRLRTAEIIEMTGRDRRLDV